MTEKLTERRRDVQSNARTALNQLESLTEIPNIHEEVLKALEDIIRESQLQPLKRPERATLGELKLIESQLTGLSEDIQHARKVLKSRKKWHKLRDWFRGSEHSSIETQKIATTRIATDLVQLRATYSLSKPEHNLGPRQDFVAAEERDRNAKCEEWSSDFQKARGVHDVCSILQKALPKADWAGFLPRERGKRDGQIYSREKIQRAERVASWFSDELQRAGVHDAESGEVLSIPKQVLIHFAHICLVLQTMDCHDLAKFCTYYGRRRETCDLALPLKQVTLSEILYPETARLFESEQYRVVRRDHVDEWERFQQPVKLLKDEPLPYNLVNAGRQGGFATVSTWRHVDDSRKYYAIKEPKDLRISSHHHAIRRELEVLKKMKTHPSHPHVIELIGVLERPGSLMLVLKPAAFTDLFGFLNSFRANNRTVNSSVNLEYPRRVLLSAFGCLSHGLCHIHVSVRHRDLKPENILYVKGESETAKLVIADFGNAHYYGRGNPSSTESQWGYSRRCIAPEVLRSDQDYMRHQSAAARNRFKEQKDSGKADPSSLSTIECMAKSHDMPSDVFSLGACFMDILSALVTDPLPNPAGREYRDYVFAEHTTEIQEWANDHERRQGPSALKRAFHVARHMLEFCEHERWSLKEVIEYIAEIELSTMMFCGKECRAGAMTLVKGPSTTTANHAPPKILYQGTENFVTHPTSSTSTVHIALRNGRIGSFSGFVPKPSTWPQDVSAKKRSISRLHSQQSWRKDF